MDGVGDFAGMTSRLDYLSRLGVTTIWLNPIHPSPRRDGGYDITDHYGVHPRFGSLGDFCAFLNGAGERWHSAESRSLRAEVNHGCWSLVWLATKSNPAHGADHSPVSHIN
jgi:hypothetical protein